MADIKPTQIRLLTPLGRSAVAVVRVAGSDAARHIATCFQRTSRREVPQMTPDEIAYGTWNRNSHDGVEQDGEGVVVSRRTPSENGEAEVFEVHCHGGSVAAQRIIADLIASGCAESFADKPATISSEATSALPNALTERTAMILADQLGGAISDACRHIATLIDEHLLHDAEESLQALLATYRIGQHLTEPWQVVIAGPANVGKSSLINAIVGFERAIVFNQPGTTRDVVTAATAVDGWPIELADTAGFRSATSNIEAMGIQRARERFANADIAVLVTDARSETEQSEETEGDEHWTALRQVRPDAILVRNKCDLITASDHAAQDNNVILTSATEQTGIEDLLTAISDIIRQCGDASHDSAIGRAILFTERQNQVVMTALQQLQSGHPDEAKRTLLAC